MDKLKVFVIMPFDEELNDLYQHLKVLYSELADLQRADDFLNQQNILKDIILPIFKADLIIADLTGLNANVFYELGLAHAFRKNVVLITQDISELPFDLRSYRAIEYSTHFARIKDFEEKLSTVILNFRSISFGSPVSDWITVQEHLNNLVPSTSTLATISNNEIQVIDIHESKKNEEEKGFLDFTADLEESMEGLTSLIEQFGEKTEAFNTILATHTVQAEKSTKQGINASNLRKLARTMAQSMQNYGQFVSKYNNDYESLWSVVEESLTNLIDSPFTSIENNKYEFESLINTLSEVKDIMLTSKGQIHVMAEGAAGLIGIEASITRAASLIAREIKHFEGLIDKSVSTLDRVVLIGRERYILI